MKPLPILTLHWLTMKEKDSTKNKWEYLEELVDDAHEVSTEPKQTKYFDSNNFDASVCKKQSQKLIIKIFISLALLLNLVLVSLIVLDYEPTKEDQIQVIFHDHEGKIYLIIHF